MSNSHWFGEGQYKLALHFRTGILRVKVNFDPRNIGIGELKKLSKEYAYDFKEFLSVLIF